MTITTTTCTVIKCDGCGDGWQHQDEYGLPHFPSEAEALEELLKDRDDGGYGWMHVPHSSDLLCEHCAQKRRCRLQGHEWSAWRDCLCGGRMHPLATQVRYCEETCGEGYEQRTVDGATAPCAAPAPPLETSRGAQLVQHLRNHNLFIEQRPEYASYPPPDMPLTVVEQVHAAAELVAQIDAALPDDFQVR